MIPDFTRPIPAKTKETTMKKLLLTLAMALMPFAAIAQPTAPAGGYALDCDQTMWKPIMSELNPGTVLYWNNRTCPAASGATDVLAVKPPPEDPIEEESAS